MDQCLSRIYHKHERARTTEIINIGIRHVWYEKIYTSIYIYLLFPSVTRVVFVVCCWVWKTAEVTDDFRRPPSRTSGVRKGCKEFFGGSSFSCSFFLVFVAAVCCCYVVVVYHNFILKFTYIIIILYKRIKNNFRWLFVCVLCTSRVCVVVIVV